MKVSGEVRDELGDGTLREAYDPKYIGRRARRPIVK